MPDGDGSTFCSLCNRVVNASDVNRSGRCSECAGVRSSDDKDDDE